jgi:signal transduction histidine kinase
MASELGKLTGQNIIFENSSNFNGRLDTLVETNLYRITQEAVNNAVKYAKANFILVRISHTNNLLSIVIDDDGQGFDPEDIESKNDGSGMGLSFMRERMQFIQGRMFIYSELQEGTRITLNVPLGQ